MKAFINGMAKCLDLGGTLFHKETQKTVEEAFLEDWKAIGADMYKAMGVYEKNKKHGNHGHTIPRPNSTSNNFRTV